MTLPRSVRLSLVGCVGALSLLIVGCAKSSADASASSSGQNPPPATSVPQAQASHEAASAPAGLPAGHPAIGGNTPPPGADAQMPAPAEAKLIDPVPAAPGGTPIADVWANRKSLAGKVITVRGRVMKYNAEIMGLNWIHLQDGSGVVKDGTHDLTITSNSEAKVGDIVTITGTVGIDKDFSMGYKYPVMIQGAKIAK